MPIYTGTKTFKAIENIAAGDAVYIEVSDLLDNMEIYADNTAIQAVWIDSDVSNKFATSLDFRTNDSAEKVLSCFPSAGNNNGDYIDRTITSKDLTGYTVHLVCSASANSGDWEFLLASGANAATANVKQGIVVSGTDPQHISFAISGMAADNGSYNPATTTHVGIRCLDDTSTFRINKIWFEKSGTSFYGIKKATGTYNSDITFGGAGIQVIGFSTAAITANNFGSIVLNGPIKSGFSGLIPSFVYYTSSVTAGTIFWDLYTPRVNQDSSYDMQVGIAVSDTELMIVSNKVVNF